MSSIDVQQEALSNARQGQSLTNYPAIYGGFMAKGIAEADIKPRENVFTFNAWKALGRSVKKGEHGVKVITFVPCTSEQRDPSTGETTATTFRRPHTTTVFHITQTELTAERAHRSAQRGNYRDRLSTSPATAMYADPGELAADRWNEQHGDRLI